MDVESSATIQAAITAGEAALGRQLAQANIDITAALDRATGEVSNIVQGAITGLQAIADKAAADFNAIIGRLDGATVTGSASIKLGPKTL